MTGKNKLILFTIFLLALSIGVNAVLIVKIQPTKIIKLNETEILELYPEETANYSITVWDDEKPISNLALKISVDNTLSIIDNSRKVQSVVFHTSTNKANEKKEINFRIKAISLKEEMQDNISEIEVKYSYNKFKDFYSTNAFVRVNENPLISKISVEKNNQQPNEDNAIIFGLDNTGNEIIQNLKIKILYPQGIDSKITDIEFPAMSPKDKYSNKRFEFTPNPELKGEKTIILLMTYTDSFGMHEIEKEITFNIEDKNPIIYFVIAAILVLVIISLIARKNRPEPKPELREAEIEELPSNEFS